MSRTISDQPRVGEGRVQTERPVRGFLVVVLDVDAEHGIEMLSAEDEHPVQALPPYGSSALGLSLATRVGSLVYTSAMVGFDGETLAVPEDLEAEIRLAFSNLARILDGVGTSFDHVLEQTTFLVGDPAVVYPVFQKVRAEVFTGRLAANMSVFVAALVDSLCHCEIKLVAAVPPATARREADDA